MRDSRQAIAEQRLRNQRLAGPPFGAVADVVRWLGATQAQEYAVARWTVGQRATGLTAANVDRAIANGEVVRTHVLRDTWHLVASEDVRWLLDLTAPRIRRRTATMHRRLGLDAPFLARTDAALTDALAGGRQLTRKALAHALAERDILVDGPRLTYMLMHAELGQLIASGARDWNQHTYALLDERVPRRPACERDEALGELVRRFFTSHGPATVNDFTWWSSLTVADTNRGLQIAGGELERTQADGRTFWSATFPESRPRDAPFRAHLLQGFDEYLVAYRESRDVFDLHGLARRVPDGQTRFTHAILLDGQVIGHWRRGSTKRRPVELQLARPLDDAEAHEVDRAVERYVAFTAQPAAEPTRP